MSDIFLSYKREDKPRAEIIAAALERQGYSVWWDRIIPPGKSFDEVIEEELDASKCVVVLWSKESVKSNWVKTEASEGDSRGILVPVLIDDIKIPLEFRRIQAAQLIDWKGALPNPEFNSLLTSVKQILSRSLELKLDAEKQSINEVNISEKVDRVKKFPSKIAPIWKWGSMIVSLSIISIDWYIMSYVVLSRYLILPITGLWAIFAIPTIIYLMYKERLEETKYGQKLKYVGIWNLVIAFLWLFVTIKVNEFRFLLGILFSIPALLVDLLYIYSYMKIK